MIFGVVLHVTPEFVFWSAYLACGAWPHNLFFLLHSYLTLDKCSPSYWDWTWTTSPYQTSRSSLVLSASSKLTTHIPSQRTAWKLVCTTWMRATEQDTKTLWLYWKIPELKRGFPRTIHQKLQNVYGFQRKWWTYRNSTGILFIANSSDIVTFTEYNTNLMKKAMKFKMPRFRHDCC